MMLMMVPMRMVMSYVDVEDVDDVVDEDGDELCGCGEDAETDESTGCWLTQHSTQVFIMVALMMMMNLGH